MTGDIPTKLVLRILVIDDSKIDRLAVKRSLTRYADIALEITEKTSGQSALELDLSEFDGIFCDLHLPDMTGIELLETLQEGSELPCPVVVVTGSVTGDMGQQCLEAGAHDYIDKARLSEPTLWRAFTYAQSRHAMHIEINTRATELEQLNQELASKNTLKSEFLASATHELRTPVSAIAGFVDLLRSETMSEQASEFVQKIGLCCNSLTNSINDVLDLSKIEAGEFRSHSVTFSPEAVVQQVLDPLQVLAANKKIVLKKDIEGLPELLRGDSKRVHQLLVNLGSNALKFTREGSIIFRAYPGPANEDSYVFEVEDTGCGVKSDELERIFERHYQANNQEGEALELGTGLGLSIVKEIVAQLGGTCGCRSTVGEGSTFWFELSLEQPSEHSVEQPIIRTNGRDHQAKRVLLAEDNSMLSQIFVNQVKKLGHEIVSARNGVEALEKFVPSDFDIVILDSRMPQMGGIDTSANIRKKYPEWNGPIYILTADATLPVKNWREHGVDKVYIKPMSPDVLKKLLASL